ncbi:alpha and gamma adaptin binding protein p34-domain-containing protein [Scenedesmus sp. NREL 46B-D3]|nr:alpha and gamma adaptin binding protein p34-domain-containing protein [Scenedesmus sp. NREL 46B-D3]
MHSTLSAKHHQHDMEGTAPDPACLFVGPPEVGKVTLIRALQSSAEPKAPSPADYTLRLDTKYYTADVLVRALGTHQQDKQQQLPAHAWEQLQALVLVFDASSEASFVSARSWADARETDSIEVKLLVANKADRLQQQSTRASSAAAGAAGSCRAPWLHDAVSWCVDKGFEYVEAAAGKPAVDAALHLEGEQQGVVRVLAALQAHLWPGMLQKDWQPRNRRGVRGADDVAAEAAAGGGSAGSCKDQDRPAAATDAAGGSDAGAGDTSAAACSMASPADHQQQQPANGAQLQQGGPANGRAPTQQQQQQQQPSVFTAPVDKDDGDYDLDDFEQMMKQLQGMRSRLSHLPDDERRTAAADMALKLASMWGLGDEDGSSDEGDAAVARADRQQQLDVRK